MDTRDTRVQNLLFLLSAAPIGLGCVITGDDGETDAATTAATTNADTGETDPTAAATTEQTTAMTTAMTGDTTEGPADTTEGPADTTEGPGETTGGTEPRICLTYGDQITECYMDEKAGAAATEYCAEILAAYEKTYGPDCVAAFEDYLACLSALTCEEFTGPDPVCEKEGTAIETACAPA